MKNVLEQIKEKAKALKKTIVLCEGEDPRVVKAAADATKEGIAKIVLLGNEEEIKKANPDADLTGVTIVNPLTSDKLAAYNARLCELRASKGMTPDQAEKLLKDGTYFGAMMLKEGDVDGLVSGACHSTANTLRPGLQIIKTAPGVSSVSSFNLMICPPQGNQYCPDGLVVFADCGLNPTYTSEGLADCRENRQRKSARFKTGRRIAVRRGDRSLGGGAQSARFRRGGQGERVYFPRPAGGQYRLQNCGATRRIHGGRTYLPRIRETSERSFPRVQIRGHRGGGGDYRASDAALRENLREEV